ncbi:conserved protein of unknown function [Bradyrhizobium vignae]|uniref:DUF2892 domain-containing protein n=1 Tax=Bradyrhizobium vignae TaxID=1549949 RepID=A0A2U3PVJ9_9BRAD|nr:conserved protein of unknown function [Bradyrhizobium vignae]
MRTGGRRCCPSRTLAHERFAWPGVEWRPNSRFAMHRAVAYAISTVIVLLGVWIIAAGLSSGSPVLWIVVGLVPIVTGLVSAFCPT